MCQELGLELISKKFTCDILDTIIRETGGVKHKSWRFGDGFRKEDSFISEVCRLVVTGVKEDQSEFDLSMIVKLMPKNLSRRMSVRSKDFFRNEINFYERVLKKFDSFQKARNVFDGLLELPRCYASFSDGENDFIALEDLTIDGYETTDKSNGLNFDQCKQIMAILGKFHAISLAFRDQEPDEFEKLIDCIEETYYSDKLRHWYEPYQRAFIIASRDAITREYGETTYVNKMLEFTGSTFYETMCALAQTTNSLSVICHGDLWTPNFLFKYDNDNKDVNAKMIDFQLARFASPATDLSFFVYACTEQDVRERHFDELIQIYHQSVTSMLSALGSNATMFPFNALQEELKNYGKFGVGMAMGALSLCVTNNDENTSSKVTEIEDDAVVPMDKILLIEPCKTKQGRLRMSISLAESISKFTSVFLHSYHKPKGIPVKMLETASAPVPLSLSTTPETFDPYVCNLSPKFKKIALDELREDDNIRGQALAQFREWIAKHPHIKKCRTDAVFLLRFLRTKKFSVPAACEMLQRYLTIRQLYPQWFKKLDMEDKSIDEIISSGYLIPLPERDANGRQLILSCAGKFDPYKHTSEEMARTHSLVCEALLDDEESQVAGYTYVNDESGLSMGLLSLWSLSDIRCMIKCIQNSTPMRHKETHFMNMPSYANKVVEFAMTVLTDKLKNRVVLHKTLDELKTKVDPKLLPKEYGGTMPLSEMIEIFKERVRKQRAAILALDDMYIEITKESVNFAGNDDVDMDPGMVGSFRKLQVD